MPAHKPVPDRPGERGTALLTVLLLVAVIAVLAAAGLEKLRLATRLSGNLVALDQARGYAMAAETLALQKVSEVLGRDPSRVTLAGGWSGAPISLPVPGGVATVRVTDAGNCFNLNGLVVRAEVGRYLGYSPARDQFVKLMTLVGVPVQAATGIAEATTDWIDSDNDTLGAGAEDGAYAGGDDGYLPANTLMVDASELRAVRGVTAEAYARLRPWICALPYAGGAKINVNTLLPEQAPLLAMLLPDGLGVEGARQLLLRRPPLGYSSTNAFWKAPALAGKVPSPDAIAMTSVTSQWFALRVDVSQGAVSMQEHAIIDARRLPARLVSRQWGEDR